MQNFIDEFTRIQDVIRSCKTEDQYNNAINWARNWCDRMCIAYPTAIENCDKLYENLIK